MAIPETVIEDIKIKNDIADVIASYVSLKRTGSNLSGLCPFHNEKTPSFTVFNATQTFHCFGCGAGGDVVTFIRKAENLEYIDALKFLAKRVGVSIPEDDNAKSGVRKSRILELNRAAARFFFETMKTSENALAYFAKRQLSSETIRHFGLGYSPNDSSFYSSMRSKGFTDDELVAARLCTKKDNGKVYSYFFNRVMFPIFDASGAVIAFGGRVLDNSEPKYLNSPDTPVFKKSRNLFALNFAKDAVNDRELILCEGYMDVIALHAAGFCNAVATLGTALTQEQARIIKRYADTVILSYDSDNAGRKATERALGIFSEVGIEARVIQMENAKDPDEFIKKFGSDAFRKLIDAGASSFDFKLKSILSKYELTSPDAKLAAAKAVCNEAARMDSEIEREILILRAAERLGISADSLKHEVKSALKRRNTAEKKERVFRMEKTQSGIGDKINPERSENLKAATAEEAILGIFIAFPERLTVLDCEVSPITEDDFITSFNRKVFSALVKMHKNGGSDVSVLGEEFSTEEMARIYRFGLNRNGLSSDTASALKENIEALKNAKLSRITDLSELINAKRMLGNGDNKKI